MYKMINKGGFGVDILQPGQLGPRPSATVITALIQHIDTESPRGDVQASRWHWALNTANKSPLKTGRRLHRNPHLPHLMSPSSRPLLLALATLAIYGVEGFKFQRRADSIDANSTQGLQNILITTAEQTLFYTPMQFGSGGRVASTYGVVSTIR